jgi:hypothetical protein
MSIDPAAAVAAGAAIWGCLQSIQAKRDRARREDVDETRREIGEKVAAVDAKVGQLVTHVQTQNGRIGKAEQAIAVLNDRGKRRKT